MFINACENPFLCIHVCMYIGVFKYITKNEIKLYVHTVYMCTHTPYRWLSYTHPKIFTLALEAL